MYKHILIPTDGSDVAQNAVSSGIEFARESGARVTLFTAVPEYRAPSEGEVMARRPIVSISDFERQSAAKAHGVLSGAAGQARAAGVECDTDFAPSDFPWRAIIDAAERHGCDAIFMGSHGRRGFARLFNGDQAIDVLTHSDIPTLVVPMSGKERQSMYQHILIPTDGSEVADKAVSSGIEFARESGARVTLFTAVPEYELPTESAVISGNWLSQEDHALESERKARAILSRPAERARAARLEFDTDYAQSDEPWKAIIAAAQKHGCDAIFMGSHGRKGLSAAWHGSQAREVLGHSKLPILVLR